MWVLPLLVKNAFSARVISSVSVASNRALVVASVSTMESMVERKHLRFYPEVVNYLFKKFAPN